MKIYSHDDPALRPLLGKISRYARQAEVMGVPYWVLVEDSSPLGLVAIGREPVQLLAPPGTPMAMIYLIDANQPDERMAEFTSKALSLARERAVEYALALFSSKEEAAIAKFKELGFRELDDAYQMICPLDRSYEPSGILRFERVRRDEMRRFLELAATFLRGSPDVMLGKALEHLLEVPDRFLDFFYAHESFFFARKEGAAVGIINFSINEGVISNIGVHPQHRGKGYGRQIMLFGLARLREGGCEQARLRVHVKNEPAIRLYESLGFIKADRYKTLIWRRPAKT